ncbi:MAG: aminotransferase class I/II-fold pyridoxal phosphate-dependent enzyme [archaeon]
MIFVVPKIQSKFGIVSHMKSMRNSEESITRFEKEFSDRIGRTFSIATFTGRSALIAILKSIGLKKGDEVLIPGFTFIGIPQIISAMGYSPVLVDVDETLCIDSSKIEELVSAKSKVLLVVHNLGNPCDMDKITAICNKHNLFLIEDCAHTISSKYKGKNVGSFGDVCLFSFHYSKIINTEWGGMACTDNKDLAERIRSNVNKFKEQTKSMLLKRIVVSFLQSIATSPLAYTFIFRPANKIYKRLSGKDIIDALYSLKPQDLETHQYKFTGYQAELGCEELRKIDSYNQTRKRLLEVFNKEIKGKIKLQTQTKHSDFIPLQLALFSKGRDQLIEKLEKKRIEAKKFYISCIPESDDFSGCRNNCETAKRLNREIIYLPTFMYQSEKTMKYIADCICEIET